MKQTIKGTQVKFSSTNLTHAEKREEMQSFRKYINCPAQIRDYMWGGVVVGIDESNLGDLLVTVLMDNQIRLSFPASDVYINPIPLVFCVGDVEGNEWSLRGVFEVESMAVKACTHPNHFVGPLELNKLLPDAVTKWPDLYYPLSPKPKFKKGGLVTKMPEGIPARLSEGGAIIGSETVSLKEFEFQANEAVEIRDMVENTTYEVPFDYFIGRECRLPYDSGKILNVRVENEVLEFEVQVRGSGGVEWYPHTEVFTSMSVSYNVSQHGDVLKEVEQQIADAFAVPSHLLGGDGGRNGQEEV